MRWVGTLLGKGWNHCWDTFINPFSVLLANWPIAHHQSHFVNVHHPLPKLDTTPLYVHSQLLLGLYSCHYSVTYHVPSAWSSLNFTYYVQLIKCFITLCTQVAHEAKLFFAMVTTNNFILIVSWCYSSSGKFISGLPNPTHKVPHSCIQLFTSYIYTYVRTKYIL